MSTQKRLAMLLILVLAIFALAFAPLAAGKMRADWLISKRLTVLFGGADFYSDVDMNSHDITSVNDLTVSGITSVSSLTVSGTCSGCGGVDDVEFLNFEAQTSLTVTNGAYFTPTGTLQPIASAAAATPVLAECGNEGDVLQLMVLDSAAITLSVETTYTVLSAVWTVAGGSISALNLTCIELEPDLGVWIETSRW